LKPNGKKILTDAGGAANNLLRLAGYPDTIEQAVEKIVSHLLIDVSVGPTDLAALQPKLNICDIQYADIPFSGELRRHKRRLKIICSVDLSEERRRFTIAHEMGHAVFESLGREPKHSEPELERLCDMLAAEILMPRQIFLDKLGSDVTISQLFQLKHLFQVSLRAIAFRCFSLRKLSIFEYEADEVKWGCGIVKKESGIDFGLRLAVEDAVNQPTGAMEVFYNERGETHMGELSWSRISKSRTLFLLTRSNQKAMVTGPHF